MKMTQHCAFSTLESLVQFYSGLIFPRPLLEKMHHSIVDKLIVTEFVGFL